MLLYGGNIWVSTNVIMMSVHVKSSATKEQSRTLELIPGGNMLFTVHVHMS